MLIIGSSTCVFALLIVQLSPRLEAKMFFRKRVPAVTSPAPQTDTDFPVRLKIPSIGVDAAIESVGLTAKKAMDVPKNSDNVGWYNLGPRPGDKGNAVLAGHLDWYYGKTAVFQHLSKLKVGDVLSVETDQGKSFPFVVREIRTYKPNEHALDVFKKSDGRHLNLVTCGGIWDTFRKMYSERLVVFTDAVDLSEK